MSEIRTKPATGDYRKGWERIFKKKKPKKPKKVPAKKSGK